MNRYRHETDQSEHRAQRESLVKRIMWAIATRLWWLLPVAFLACASGAPAPGGLAPTATRTVTGTLTSVERDSRYEQRCGVLCRITGGESARAYAAIVTDSTGHAQYFWFFALDGNIIPHVGTVGDWRLHRRVIYDIDRCNSYGCPSFPDWQLDRLEDGPQP